VYVSLQLWLLLYLEEDYISYVWIDQYRIEDNDVCNGIVQYYCSIFLTLIISLELAVLHVLFVCLAFFFCF